MSTSQTFDGSIFVWITILMFVVVVVIFGIKAFAKTKSAQNSLENHKSQERLNSLEKEIQESKERLSAIEKVLNDVG